MREAVPVGGGGLPQVILSDENNSQALHFRGGEPWHFNAGKNTDKRKYTSSFLIENENLRCALYMNKVATEPVLKL